MTSWAEVGRQVAQRAAGRCEYCKMHQSLQGATFHIEHINPRCLGGGSQLNNLAWACPSCNLHKSARTDAPDFTERLVPLFNPREHHWDQHFAWEDYLLMPLTEIGRATIALLHLNHERRIRIRQAEELFDLFPPVDVQDVDEHLME